jgi:hypothetical protein
VFGGGKQKIVGPPTIIPDGKVIFQKESATASKTERKWREKCFSSFFPFSKFSLFLKGIGIVQFE